MFGLFVSLLSSEKKRVASSCRTEEEVEEATGRETIIESTTNAMILIVDHYHRGCVCLFLRERLLIVLLLLVSSFSKRERERERERERDRIPLLEFLSRRVVFSLLLCFFLSRSLGFALLTRATNTALSISHRTTIPKIFRMAHRETAHRQAKR